MFEAPSTAEQRRAARADTVGHSGVQPWSAGDLFPAVIARVERYRARMTLEDARAMRAAIGYGDEERWIKGASSPSRLECTSFELTIGAYREEYATREDAEMVARWVCQGGRIIPARYAELIGKAARTPDAFADTYCAGVRDDD